MMQEKLEEPAVLSGAGVKDVFFLEGPKPRGSELRFAWRVFMEMIRGFRTLHFIGPCVTVFGSARFSEEHPHYKLARQVGGSLARMGFAVMTGGGPGIMEAANRGAREAGGRSIGCTIVLPQEEAANPYMDKWVTFRHFFVRKLMLIKYSYAFVIMPGGFGTMDEVFEALTLIQTGKIRDFPVIVMGRDYWREIQVFLNKMMEEGTIGPRDLDLVFFTDSVDEAMEHIQHHAVKKFGLTPRYTPIRVLGE